MIDRLMEIGRYNGMEVGVN